MNTHSHQTARLPGRAMKYILAWLLVLPAFAQTVDTHIPLSELESLKLNAFDKDIQLIELKLRPMRADVANMEAEIQATIKAKRALEESILAEHYLNPQEYGISLQMNAIFKVDEPTPRPER